MEAMEVFKDFHFAFVTTFKADS